MATAGARTRLLREELKKTIKSPERRNQDAASTPQHSFQNLMEASGGAIPVIGRPQAYIPQTSYSHYNIIHLSPMMIFDFLMQVCGGKARQPTKILERPTHTIPPATWHLNPDIDTMVTTGPLEREQLEDFHKDGFLFIPDFYSPEA